MLISAGRLSVDKGRGRGSNLPPAIAERLARHKAQEQLVYKRKMKLLRQIVKDLVFVRNLFLVIHLLTLFFNSYLGHFVLVLHERKK